jgi:hypothetical protein
MNISSDPTIAETLRSLANSTVRGILQTSGVQSISSEIRQQTTAPKSQFASSNPNNSTSSVSPDGASSTRVELSAAAKFPPLASITRTESIATRPSDLILSASLPLPATLGMLTVGNLDQKVREVMQLAIKLSQVAEQKPSSEAAPEQSLNTFNGTANIPSFFTAPGFAIAQYASMKPWVDKLKPNNLIEADLLTHQSGIDSVKHEISTIRNEAQKLEAMYAQNGTQINARIDLNRVGADSTNLQKDPAAFAATLQVKLPVLGDILITLSLCEARSDLAFAASPDTVDLLKLTQAQFRQAAAGWGLNLQGLSFIPFIRQEDK